MVFIAGKGIMLRLMIMLLLLLNAAGAAASYATPTPPQALSLYSRQPQPNLNFSLSGADWRWLGLKKELSIATWEPQSPPLDIVLEPGIFEGISADYLSIISRQLGVQPRILRYSTRMAALRAVNAGEVDMMIDDQGSPDIDA